MFPSPSLRCVSLGSSSCPCSPTRPSPLSPATCHVTWLACLRPTPIPLQALGPNSDHPAWLPPRYTGTTHTSSGMVVGGLTPLTADHDSDAPSLAHASHRPAAQCTPSRPGTQDPPNTWLRLACSLPTRTSIRAVCGGLSPPQPDQDAAVIVPASHCLAA
jgi:hypothetical protein